MDKQKRPFTLDAWIIPQLSHSESPHIIFRISSLLRCMLSIEVAGGCDSIQSVSVVRPLCVASCEQTISDPLGSYFSISLLPHAAQTKWRGTAGARCLRYDSWRLMSSGIGFSCYLSQFFGANAVDCLSKIACIRLIFPFGDQGLQLSNQIVQRGLGYWKWHFTSPIGRVSSVSLRQGE